MDDCEALTVKPGAWGPQAERYLSQAVAHASLKDYRLQIATGASLFYVEWGGQTVGAFLLRVDNTAKGPEGVIVAAAADLHGVDMTATILPVIESLFRGVVSVRYHTAKPALARKLHAYGYTSREIVCAKEITP